VVDLDVLTIGALLEMEANDAAQNVYWWNKYGLSLSQTMDDVSLSDMATRDNHEFNTNAQYYDSEYVLDDLIISVIQKTGDFASASGVERRAVVEALLTTVVLPIYALDSMYNAIDICDIAQVEKAASEWDKAAASLIGFTESALFFNLGSQLCEFAPACTSAEVNTNLLQALNDGQDQLLNSDCISAQEKIYEIELMMQVGAVPLLPFSLSDQQKHIILHYLYSKRLF
jgi:hypothetical protein